MLNKLAYQNNVKMPKYEDIPKPADEQYSIKDFFVHPKSSESIWFVRHPSSIIYSSQLTSLRDDMSVNVGKC